jgi:hypothetical protein
MTAKWTRSADPSTWVAEHDGTLLAVSKVTGNPGWKPAIGRPGDPGQRTGPVFPLRSAAQRWAEQQARETGWTVAHFLHQVDRFDHITPVCGRPRPHEGFWDGGYLVAMTDVLRVMEESVDRTGSPAHVLHDVLQVVRAAVEAGSIEDHIEHWIGQTIDRWTYAVNESGY